MQNRKSKTAGGTLIHPWHAKTSSASMLGGRSGPKDAWACRGLSNFGGGPYYNYGLIYPEALFELIRTLYWGFRVSFGMIGFRGGGVPEFSTTLNSSLSLRSQHPQDPNTPNTDAQNRRNLEPVPAATPAQSILSMGGFLKSRLGALNRELG